MGRQRFTVETIVRKLREAEVDLSRGQSVAQVVKKLGVCEQTYYRWRKEYGGLRLDRAKRLKELETENNRIYHGNGSQVSPSRLPVLEQEYDINLK